MPALAQKKTQGMDDLYFTMKFAWQKLGKYFAEVTSTMGIHFMSAHIYETC